MGVATRGQICEMTMAHIVCACYWSSLYNLRMRMNARRIIRLRAFVYNVAIQHTLPLSSLDTEVRNMTTNLLTSIQL